MQNLPFFVGEWALQRTLFMIMIVFIACVQICWVPILAIDIADRVQRVCFVAVTFAQKVLLNHVYYK